jgi:hypothetical protein
MVHFVIPAKAGIQRMGTAPAALDWGGAFMERTMIGGEDLQ